MSSDSDPLRHLLETFQSQGEAVDPGAFTLDPRRATEILRGQGRLGQNAFLYLLTAIHAHTDGAPVSRSLRPARSWRFEWSPAFGSLLDSLELTLAEASFETHGVSLSREPNAVKLRSKKLEGLYAEVADRLRYYPFEDVQGAAEAGAFLRTDKLALFPARERAPRFLQVVRGVSYATRWALPIDAVCHDPLGRPDLALSTIPDSARKQAWMEAAEEQFLRALRDSLEGAAPCLLSPDRPSSELPLFATYLSYIVAQTRDPELRRLGTDRVLFPDATERIWTTTELLEIYARQKRLMIVDSRPEGPTVRSDRPVLLWTGQVEVIGRSLFGNLAFGAGYLYSLAVNELEKQRLAPLGEPRLASLPVPNGTLSLLPWGEPHRTAEVEFLGPRRARETFYLDEQAPHGLRLIWESRESREEELRQLVFEQHLRHVVLELIDASLDGQVPGNETIRASLLWALSLGPLDWSRLPRLSTVPLLARADGEFATVAELLSVSGPVAVLADLSSSLPRVLPVRPLLWSDPLLEKLGLETLDVSRQIREAYWQEVGRDRWLAAHPPKAPDWPPGARRFGPHLVARAANAKAPTEVGFWREGRPFGRRLLPPDQCPPGCLVMWVEDDLPGDIYWSGPAAEALAARLPRLAALCSAALSEADPS